MEFSYYHDRYRREADGVLHLKNGKYALLEFKLGTKEIDEGARHLLDNDKTNDFFIFIKKGAVKK